MSDSTQTRHSVPGSIQTVRLLMQFSGRRLFRVSAASLLRCCSRFLSSFSRALAALCRSLSSFRSLAFSLAASISSLVRRLRAGLGVPPNASGRDRATLESLLAGEVGRFVGFSSEQRASGSPLLMAQPAEKAYYRFLVLFFNCLLTFGSYFCFDIPSVLQDQFQGNLTCPNATATNGTVDCVEGLGMSPQQYNLLYAVYAWTCFLSFFPVGERLCLTTRNAVVVILAGFLIDKLGNRFGVFLFSFLCVLGSSLFALGSHFRGTPYLLPLMLTGRLLFGSGNGSLTIVQNRITAFWFKGKELALAFGVTLAFSRLGSVLNFFFTEKFEDKYGMQWTLWGGALLCVLGFVAAVVVSALDKIGMRQLGLDGAIAEESRKVRVQDVKLLSLRYWLLVLTIMFFYNGIFPFIADARIVLLPGLGAQNLPDDEVGHADADHLYGGGQAHGCSQRGLRHHEGDGRPHAGLEQNPEHKTRNIRFANC
ncbi:hypothetical protein CCH79_00015601 [Gambusia affinis]|uniref:Lysosomal dipeptide transporter MFSD1 n=1 Tax=Gambusia affinis TaxID=33528 RepID=A0A315VEZ0_GAMAF|nr:hypothetical protein CCH79_00015601 [Gambusia affinis]